MVLLLVSKRARWQGGVWRGESCLVRLGRGVYSRSAEREFDFPEWVFALFSAGWLGICWAIVMLYEEGMNFTGFQMTIHSCITGSCRDQEKFWSAHSLQA